MKMKTRVAECERVTATAISPSHLREVRAGEELRPGGSFYPLHTLCGRELAPGSWDLREVTDPELVRRRADIPSGTPGRLCQECATAFVGTCAP